jgi:hypothetical protein
MSYSFNADCFMCVKKVKCVDADIIQGAIQSIHQLTPLKGHWGAGMIELHCQQLEMPKEKDKE